MNQYSALHALGQLQRIAHRRRFENAVGDPEHAQTDRFKIILDRCRDTAFGRKYHLGEVRSLRELQQRVPIQNGDTLRPWVERAMHGERNVLSREKPLFYALSSGTTGHPKRMPVTPTYRREFQLSLLTSMAYTYDRHRSAFTGSVFYNVAKRHIGNAPDGTPIGFTSGYNFSKMPSLVRRAYAVPYEAFEVSDERARAYLIALLCSLSGVTVIGAIFPLAITELLRAVEGEGDALVRDLRRGSLRDDIQLSAAERAFFSPFAKSAPRLADRIEQSCRSHGGRLTGWALFESLKLVYCWTSGSAGQYVEEVKRMLPDGIAVADAVYATNEGWCNVPLADGQPGGPISILSHFYEFIEEHEWERGVREGVGAHALKPGQSYRILISTSAGVLRYDPGDIVECSGFYGATPRIHFARRAGASYNLAGERLTELNVQRAVAAASSKFGIFPRFFCAVPLVAMPPRWELLIEFSSKLGPEELQRWRTEIDAQMCNANLDYAGRRLAHIAHLRPLALRVVEPGSFDRYRHAKLQAGAPVAQSKVVNLETNVGAYADMAPWQLVELGAAS